MFDQYKSYELKGLLQMMGMRCPAKKDDCVNLLVDHVFGKDLKKTWGLLSPLEKLAMAEAIYNTQGIIDFDQVKAKYGKTLVWGEQNLTGYREETPKIRLFFYKQACLPIELIERLKLFVLKPPQNTVNYLEGGPSRYNLNMTGQNTGEGGALVFYDASKTVLQELLAVLTVIKNKRLSDISGWAFTSSTNKNIYEITESVTTALVLTTSALTRACVTPDYYAPVEGVPSKNIKGFAWFVLLKCARLIDDKRNILTLTSAGDDLQRRETIHADTIKKIFESFLGSCAFDEVLRIDTLERGNDASYYSYGYQPKTEFTDPAERRALIGKALKSCAYGQWMSVSEFLRVMRIQYPPYMVVKHLRTLRLGDKKINSANLQESWPVLEGTTIKCFLMEFLATLGIIEINYLQDKPVDGVSSYDGLYEFSITALGAYCLGITQEVTQISKSSKKRFKTDDALNITTIVQAGRGDHVSARDILMMNTCADRVGPHTWKLGIPKLLGAVEEKPLLLPAFKAFLYERLEAYSQTAEDFFDDIERRKNQIVFEEDVRLYACQDTMVAHLISCDSKTRAYCRLVDAHHLVVPLPADKTFKAALKKVGYIAKMAQGTQAHAQN